MSVPRTYASRNLDWIRGLAALAVCAGHTRALFFVGDDEVLNRTLTTSAIYFLTSLHGKAVMIFFVLSGLLVGSGTWKAASAGTFSWSSYLTKRCTRLYVVLVPALVVGALWDRIGFTLAGARALYEGLDSGIIANVHSDTSWPIAFGNLIFLQRIYVPTFGSNGPLWSLTYEFWYYMMFPCLALAVISRRRPLYRAVHLVLLVAILFLIGLHIAGYFLTWLLGVAVWIVVQERPSWRIPLPVGVAALAAALAFTRNPHTSPALTNFLVATGTAVLIWAILSSARGKLQTRAQRSVAHWFADFSYSLYLCHLPLLVLIRGLVLEGGKSARWQPTWGNLLAGLGLLIVAVAYAWLMAFFTERRTDQVRHFIERFTARPTELPPTVS